MAEAQLAPPFGLTGARRAVAIAFAAVLLTGFFVMQGFPWDRLLPRIETAITDATGAPVQIERLAIGITWLAPQLRLWDVDAKLPSGRHLRLDRVRVHPAWSLSWLRGAPALVVALRSPAGEVDGTVTFGAEPAFRGELRRVQLAELPIDALAAGASLDGRADAEIDVTLAAGGPAGTVKLSAEKGSVMLPLLPIGVPFDSLRGDVELGGAEALAKIGALDVAGPMISLQASGTVGRGPATETSPLALRAKLVLAEPSLRGLVTAQGIALDADGAAEIEVGGTLGEPLVQSPRGRGRSG